MAPRVVIASAVRTPFTRALRGEFKDTRPDTLAADAIRAAVSAVPGLKADAVEDVVLGCAMPEAEQGMNVARQAALLAGLPDSVPAMTINRFCSSGSQSVANLADAIHAGRIQVGIGGGLESMTMIPMGGNKVSANPEVMEQHPEVYTSMGATAENVARKFDVTRDAQDKFAAESQRRAQDALAGDVFADEIVPLETRREGKVHLVARDEPPRKGITADGLAKLPPAFVEGGTVTAGSSSGINDGAAALAVVSAEAAEALGRRPLARILATAVAGVDPSVMGIGPVPASRKALARAGLAVEQLDLIELNEAFASQSLACIRELKLDPARVNIYGGAIALGHPLGASGARILATLVHALRRTGGRYGLATMCIGVGQGSAMVVERADR